MVESEHNPPTHSHEVVSSPMHTSGPGAPPILLQQQAIVGRALPTTLYDQPKPPGAFRKYWNKIGGGSFLLSLLIHVGLLVVAYFMVQTIVQEKKVDFLPGGGSKAGQEASQQLSQQIRNKKQVLNKTTPMRKVVSSSVNAAISLPDMPMDSLDMPEMSSVMGGGAMGSGGFGNSGAGGGFGSGIGTGGMKGFVARTVFGNLGGTGGVPGVLYDFKQDRKGKPQPYNANGYFQLVKAFADKKFSATEMKGYFQAPQQMNFTFLAVPLLAAEEGPKAFAVEKDVQPRGWLVHYTGMVTPPENGEWRFIGYFDDLLAVYINGEPVLDASRDDLVNLGESKPDMDLRQPWGGRGVLNGKCMVGKWVNLSGHFKIDILVGERPGGQVGGLLLVENRKEKYKKTDYDLPILPLFTVGKPDKEDMERMRGFSEKIAGQIGGLELKNIPIFTAGTVADRARSMLNPGIGLLPSRGN